MQYRESNWPDEKIAKWLTPDPRLTPVLARWRELGFHTLLDRGCGPGRHAMFFARNGFRVTALDRSPEALAYLRAWAAKEQLPVTTVQGDIFTLLFPDNSFDCVIDYHASFHTDTTGYLQGIRELRRVLRPGGEVYLTVKSKSDVQFREAVEADHLDRFTLHHPDGAPHFYAAESELTELFPGFSFVTPPVEIREPGKSNPRERVHYHLLLRKSVSP